MLLLDQGLPRTTVSCLRDAGLEAEHVGNIGLADADDRTILSHARQHSQVIITLDADFHTLLALSRAAGPSVIRIRIEGLRAVQLAELLAAVLERCGDDLKSGAMVTVTESGVQVRNLPVFQS